MHPLRFRISIFAVAAPANWKRLRVAMGTKNEHISLSNCMEDGKA